MASHQYANRYVSSRNLVSRKACCTLGKHIALDFVRMDLRPKVGSNDGAATWDCFERRDVEGSLVEVGGNLWTAQENGKDLGMMGH